MMLEAFVAMLLQQQLITTAHWVIIPLEPTSVEFSALMLFDLFDWCEEWVTVE